MAKAKTTKTKKHFFNENSMNFIREYLNNSSPTGYESSGQKIWLEYLKPYIDTHLVDNYGTVVGIINPDAPYKVVIEAHADEISWYVKYITSDGFIHVCRNGGSDHQIAPSKRVNIYTKKGIVRGVFGWPAIHVRTPQNEKKPEIETIWLDVNCKNKKEVEELGIHVGCVCTFTEGFEEGNNGYWIGRAFDNRMGGVIIAEVARLLSKTNKKLPFGLYIVNAVQEEVGLNGATMITQSLKPNVAICTDVTHDTTTPMMNKAAQGEATCGLGPVLSYAPAVHRYLLDIILETAKKNKIPHQLQAASRFTGTDTDAFAFSNGGVPSALISLPLRYMHTTVETIHKDDVENCIKLMYEVLLKLTPKTNYKYL
ncbi:MAG TPA: M42 family metallopeptidase [Chitinophagaceae bacterium]|nr:M42 family metallopeptidase [Chitinophagaceae bacterium]